MMSLLRRLPYINRLIGRLTSIEAQVAALDAQVARLNAQIEEHATSATQKLDSLVARVYAVEIQLEEMSRNYTELTSGGLRDILEHWEQRVRDDFAIDRMHAMQELRSEMAVLRGSRTDAATIARERHEP
jgi:hypothetical protein